MEAPGTSRPTPAEIALALSLRVDGISAEVISLLRRDGMRPILLKGPAVAAWIYYDGVRSYSDTDLLLDPDEFDRAEESLKGAGFDHIAIDAIPGDRARHARVWVRPHDGAAVDLHRTLIGVGTRPGVAWEILSRHTDRMNVAGVEAEILGESARALHVALHAVQHAGERKPREDLRRAVERVSDDVWRGAAELAWHLQAVPALGAGLRLLDGGIALAERLRLPTAITIETALNANASTLSAQGLLWLLRARGTRRKLLLIGHKIVPPVAFMRSWTTIARKGPVGLAIAYLWRPLWLALNLVPSLIAIRRARRGMTTASVRRPTVAIVQRRLLEYRIPFFEGLRKSLAEAGIELRLVYGQPAAEEVARGDAADVDWGVRIKNARFGRGPKPLWWQPCVRATRGFDLVVVEQSMKLLVNYILLARQGLGGPPVALWGHGRNFQRERESRVRDAWKRYISRRAHWWFAYTDRSAEVVQDLGFAEERTSVVQNAIDTTYLRELHAEVGDDELDAVRAELGIGSRNVAIFLGGLYDEKRPDLLVRAATLVRERVPDFELIVVGGGPAEEIVRTAAEHHPWIRHVGPRFGRDKVLMFGLARASLIPGVVGLALLDSFALEVPLITLDLPSQGPEIRYLEDGVNGLLLAGNASPEDYAEAVAELLTDDDLQMRLRKGCREAAHRYTIEEMVGRFAAGVRHALSDGSAHRR